MKKKNKIISLVLSIIIVLSLVIGYFRPVLALGFIVLIYAPTLNNILVLASMSVIFISIIYILYKYIECIIENFKNKKKLKPILMILLIILLALGIIISNIIAKTFFVVVAIPLAYMLLTIIVPLIVLGILMLKSDVKLKKRVIEVIIYLILTIGIYIINYNYLVQITGEIVNTIGNFVESKNSNSTEYNLIYLENYKQKMDRQGYIDKYDVESILNIADNRTDRIIVYYKDGDYEVQLNNVDNKLKEELQTKLEGDYYKLSYEHKDDVTNIYIERYEIKEPNNTERNSDIIINGIPNYNITNVKTDYKTKEDINYLFENNVNVTKTKETALDNLRILFVFDEEKNNYIPYVENESELGKIKSYKVYSTGMSITLKDGIKLNKKDYTIRINRYDENLKIDDEKNSKYYYKFEPVAEEMNNSNGDVVIDFDFGNTYKLEDLKNIEIIF